MNITSKSRYGLKIVLDLAAHVHLEKVARRDIVSREGIPAEYLDQIMMRLRHSGLVQSLRGRHGGYRLARAPEKISVLEIFLACEDHVIPALCVNHNNQVVGSCEHSGGCIGADPWQKIFEQFSISMQALSIAELLEVNTRDRVCNSGPLRECRSGDKLMANQWLADLNSKENNPNLGFRSIPNEVNL